MGIDSGNTAFVLIATAMVLLMTPGLAFFYGGLVRGKNVLNTMLMSVVAMGVVAIEWSVLGYSMAFAPGNAFVGGFDFLGFSGVGAAPIEGQTIPHLAFAAFQMMFAVITPALISGAVVGRMKFKVYVPFVVLWAVAIYNPLCHWGWGGGFIGKMGALDFAGGTVVHVSAGVSALVAAYVVGPRKNADKARPHNVPFVMLGAALLWFGWFGFNAGSALAADGVASLAFVTTNLAAAAALVAWCTLETMQMGKPTAVGAATAAVVGLVTITPAAGFVTPMGAVAMGMLGSVGAYGVIQMMHRAKLDDSLDVFACHGVGGIIGSILTGVFATTAVNSAGADGLLYGGAGLVWTQTIAVAAAAAFAGLGTVAILLPLKAMFGLRVDEEGEFDGMDEAAHSEGAYALEAAFGRKIVEESETAGVSALVTSHAETS